MANVLLYDKSVENSIVVRGILDQTAQNITYSENDELKKVSVQSLLKEFAQKKIDFIIYIEYEKEHFLSIDQYKNATIIGTLDNEETIICGVLDNSVKIIHGTL